MTTQTAATVPPAPSTQAANKRMFAALLEERYERAGESQADVAEWLNEFMDAHDLEAELDTIDRAAPDDLRDATMDAIAVIRNYRATNPAPSAYRELDYLLAGLERTPDGADVAGYVREYRSRMPTPGGDLDALLDRIERMAPDDRRAEAAAAVAAVRAHRAACPTLPPPYHVGQAAVSKWKNGKASPTPEKWVALARYMGLPLAELHRLIVFHEMPESVEALQRHLHSAQKDLRDRDADLARIRRELARAETAQRVAEEELSLLRLRVEGLEATDGLRALIGPSVSSEYF